MRRLLECVVIATAATRKALAAARSVKTILGSRVIGVFHRSHPYLYSRLFDSKVLVRVDRDKQDWAIAVAYTAASRDCPVVLPMDYIDYYTFSFYHRVFREVGVTLAAPPHSAIVAASDKRLLQYMNLPVPKGVIVEDGVIKGDPYGLDPPLVVKGVGDASLPRYHITVEDAVADALDRRDAVIQEFVAGRGRGYFALTVDGRPLLEYSHERLVEYEPIGGASLAAKGPIDDPELYELGRRVVEKLKWTGVIMVEMRYNLDEDRYYVIEVNPKFWGSLDLSVYCNYHFPALVAAGFALGWSAAEKLVDSLSLRRGCSFSWLLDGLRYGAKIPSVVAKLARLCARGGCDLDLLDLVRVAAQVVAAATRFRREKEKWSERLRDAGRNVRRWVERVSRIVSKNRLLIVWDLDGTLVNLPVDWEEAKERLTSAGFRIVADSVMSTLARLWRRDRRMFEKASRIVEEVEVEAVKRARLLVDKHRLVRLRRLVKAFVLITRQSSRTAGEVLSRLGVRSLFDEIIGRDAGAIVKSMVLRRFSVKGVLIDDNFETIVAAWRQGWASIMVARDEYSIARAYMLGIPAGRLAEIIELLESVTSIYKQ